MFRWFCISIVFRTNTKFRLQFPRENGIEKMNIFGNLSSEKILWILRIILPKIELRRRGIVQSIVASNRNVTFRESVRTLNLDTERHFENWAWWVRCRCVYWQSFRNRHVNISIWCDLFWGRKHEDWAMGHICLFKK